MKTICNFMQPRQDRRIVFRTENYTIHLVRGQFITRYFVGEKRIAGKHIPFCKAAQQSLGIILNRICSCSCIENHHATSHPQKSYDLLSFYFSISDKKIKNEKYIVTKVLQKRKRGGCPPLFSPPFWVLRHQNSISLPFSFSSSSGSCTAADSVSNGKTSSA